MQTDKEGFLYPEVDTALCNDCSTCLSVCEMMKKPDAVCDAELLYGYSVNNAEREKGASGGIFGVFANHVLSDGGVVYGAAEIDGEVVHLGIENMDDLDKLRRSKYVQSRIGSTYQLIRDQLNQKRKILFVGTPCQVYGLKLFLKKEYMNLLTMDFICHGVPSPALYADFKKSAGADSVTFREKPYGWRNQVVRLYKGHRRIKTFDSLRNFYFLSFVYNYSLRKSCYACQLPDCHASDLTLGDYWTIASRDVGGVSQIKVNNGRGREALALVSPELVIHPITDSGAISACYTPHDQIEGYDKTKREDFYAYYLLNGYKKTEEYYIKNELKEKKRSMKRVLCLRLSYWKNKK